MRCIVPILLTCNLGCGMVQSATRAGMMPILKNGVDSFIAEPDLTVAEGAILANMKLIEGVALTYPDEAEPAEMAAMARANYAFGFVQDEAEAVRFAFPDDTARAAKLVERAVVNYAEGRKHSLRVLMHNSGFEEIVAGRDLESMEMNDFESALAELDEDDAPALFWLVFNWGASLQAKLDPVAATQLPKVEKMVARVLELNENVFYGLGPHMLAGALHGFRAPALGGNAEKATHHFDRAKALSKQLLPDVLKAQFVFAQSEKPVEFDKTLRAVIAAEPNPRFAALDAIAKRKACRLLANSDQFFLDDPKPLPDGCKVVSHKHRLREPE